MSQFPYTQHTPVLRTDFSDDAAWQALVAAIEAPVDADGQGVEFQASVTPIDDRRFEGFTVEQVLKAVHPQTYFDCIFVIDSKAITDPEHPVLVIDINYMSNRPGRTFRMIPSESWAVENNLSLANMDFADFADNVDDDGVFRG